MSLDVRILVVVIIAILLQRMTGRVFILQAVMIRVDLHL